MPDQSGAGPAIILVEDGSDILILLQRLLRPLAGDYTIVLAHDGAAALEQVKRRPVPLMITDYNMPAMNGLQLTAAVKAHSPTTKIALVTAYHTPQLQHTALAQGVDYYLPKPFSIDELEAILIRVLH